MRLCVIAAAAVLSASPVDAQTDLLGELRTYCVTNGADRDAVLAAADRDGWMPVPAFMMAGLPRGMTEADGRLRTTRQAMTMLFVARGALPLGREAADVDLCAVGAQPQDRRAVAQAAGRFAGVRPQRRGDMDMYVWAETAQGRRALDSPRDRVFAELMHRGEVRMLFVQGRGAMTMVGYAVPGRRGGAR